MAGLTSSVTCSVNLNDADATWIECLRQHHVGCLTESGLDTMAHPPYDKLKCRRVHPPPLSCPPSPPPPTQNNRRYDTHLPCSSCDDSLSSTGCSLVSRTLYTTCKTPWDTPPPGSTRVPGPQQGNRPTPPHLYTHTHLPCSSCDDSLSSTGCSSISRTFTACGRRQMDRARHVPPTALLLRVAMAGRADSKLHACGSRKPVSSACMQHRTG
jgi:hypothetical protein